MLAVDPVEDAHLTALGVDYVTLDEALERAHIVTLNCPLLAQTHHLINADTLALLKPVVAGRPCDNVVARGR